METLILISNQPTLYQTIAALLPEKWIVLHGDQFDQVQRYLEESAQSTDNRLIILVDINDQPVSQRFVIPISFQDFSPSYYDVPKSKKK